MSLTLREEHRMRMSENMVLRRIFEPKTEEVAAGSRRLHNEELHNLYALPNIIRLIRSRRMRWAVHVARIGVGEMHEILSLENLKGRDHVEDLLVDAKIILEWMLGKWLGR
jgi:hypothetical protein